MQVAGPGSPSAEQTVTRLRQAAGSVPGADALVGGQTATTLDTDNAEGHDEQVIIPLILGVVFCILVILLQALIAALLLLACATRRRRPPGPVRRRSGAGGPLDGVWVFGHGERRADGRDGPGLRAEAMTGSGCGGMSLSVASAYPSRPPIRRR